MNSTEIDNTMELSEVEDWCSKGKSLHDAAFGLIFKGIDLSLQSQGTDAAVEHYFRVAELLLLAEHNEHMRSAITTHKGYSSNA